MSTTNNTAPCYVRYSLRGLGLFAGITCVLLGVLNFIFHPFSIICLIFSILQICIGVFVAASEAAGSPVQVCYCITFQKCLSFPEWMNEQPAWVKPLFYILSPLLGMILCTTWFTFFGGGAVVLSGVVYAISVFKSKDGSAGDVNRIISHPIQLSQPTPQSPQGTTPTIIRIDPNNPPTGKLNNSAIKNPLGRSNQREDQNVNNNYNEGPSSKWGPGGPPQSFLDEVKIDSKKEDYSSSPDDNNYRYENIQTISGGIGSNRGQQQQVQRKVVVDYSNVTSTSSIHPGSSGPFVSDWEKKDVSEA